MDLGLPRRFVAGVLLVASWLYYRVGTAVSCELEGVRWFGMTDEQYISMRYARNLAEGHGLVWNPGEAPVEGYTNFLWTVWMAVGHLLPIPETHIVLWVVFSSLLCLVGASLFAAGIAARLRPGDPVSVGLALVGCAFYYPAMRWALTGFEVGALMCACAGAMYFALGAREGQARPWPLLFCCVVGVLLRLDAVVWIAACCAFAYWEGDAGQRRALLLRVALPLGGVVALFTAWRVQTYGAWLPNTYALKATGVDLGTRLVQGRRFVADTLQSHFAVFVLPVVIALSDREGRWAGKVGAFGVWLAALAYTLWIGGDTWEEHNFANRPLTIAGGPFLALVGLGLGRVWAWVAAARGPRVAAIVVGFAFVGSVWAHSLRNAYRWVNFDHCEAPLMDKLREALRLREALPSDARIAVVWAGVIPYYTRLPAIDLLGKSDPVIARSPPKGTRSGHNKWDYRYSIGELRPDVITSLYKARPKDRRYIGELGYREDAHGVWWHASLAERGVAIPGAEPKRGKLELGSKGSDAAEGD